MRCINSQKRKAIRALGQKLIVGLLLFSITIPLSGCGNLTYSMSYTPDADVSSLNVLNFESGGKADTFASDLCVVDTDLFGDGSIDLSDCTSAVLFDLGQKEVVYSRNAHAQLYPASITKVMTALVAIENGSMDQVLTASEAVNINESGAQLAGIKVGDQMTLYQALRILLLYSANDVANLIAENIGGSLEGFTEMMNEEAARIGATNTHFMNAHGLTDPDHYTTAYDLYLIFNEAIKYEAFTEIISLQSYETVIYDKNGKEKTVSFKNTNGYISEKFSAPANVTVIGGKTGTTAAAGHCLILLSKDKNGSPFISVVLKSESTDSLYSDMNSLLTEVAK